MRSHFLVFAPLVHVSLVNILLHAAVKLIVLVVSNDTFMSSVICGLFGAIQVSIIPNLVTTFINPRSFSITLPKRVFGCNGLLSTSLIFILTKLLTWNEIVLGFFCCHFVVVFSWCVSCHFLLRCPYLLVDLISQ